MPCRRRCQNEPLEHIPFQNQCSRHHKARLCFAARASVFKREASCKPFVPSIDRKRNCTQYGCQLLRKRTLAGLPLTKRRKVGMTSNHHALYDLGYTRTTMAFNKEKQDREVEQNSKTTSQFRLQAATRLHEVGIASNRGSACRGEYVPGPCTHRPSHHESRGDPKSVV